MEVSCLDAMAAPRHEYPLYLLQLGHCVGGQDALVKEVEQRSLKLLQRRAVAHPRGVQHQVHDEQGVLAGPVGTMARGRRVATVGRGWKRHAHRRRSCQSDGSGASQRARLASALFPETASYQRERPRPARQAPLFQPLAQGPMGTREREDLHMVPRSSGQVSQTLGTCGTHAFPERPPPLAPDAPSQAMTLKPGSPLSHSMLWIATTLTLNGHLRHFVFPASHQPPQGSVNPMSQPCLLPTHVCLPPVLWPTHCPNLPYQPIARCLDKGRGHDLTALLPRSSSQTQSMVVGCSSDCYSPLMAADHI